MEPSQGEIIQKRKTQELASLFLTHRLSVMHALVKFHIYSIRFKSNGPDTVYYMELNQGEKIQKPKMQELSSLFVTHRLIVMYAPVKFHEYIPYILGVMARTPFTICNKTREDNSKTKNARVVFLVHDTSY